MLTRIRTAMAGRYVLERVLGRGATAAVYAAHDLKHGRRVALKVIEPDVVSTLGASRFLQEIRTTARLNHPHILPLFDSGEVDGFIYYTMPLVEGESLRARLDREHRMALDAILPIALQIAGALSYAHSLKIVHRDIKPENILIGEQEHVWVADFGLARAFASATDHRLTSAGIAIGSPHYMSPEQAAGERDVDNRSDIYSLACIVFELLCGEPPFTARSVPAVLARHLSEPAPPIIDRCPGLPPEVDAALRRAMAKDPSHRFRDAQDFVAALQTPLPPVIPGSAARRANGVATNARGGPTRRRYLPWRLIAGGLLVGGAGVFVIVDRPAALFGRWSAGGSAIDTTAFVLLPIERDGSEPIVHQEPVLRSAFARWRDVNVVDARLVAAAISLGGDASSISDGLKDVARRVRGGRIVRTILSDLGDSIAVRGVLLDHDAREMATHTVRMARAETRPELHFMQLADALLFAGLPLAEGVNAGTASRAARHAYLAGLQSIDEWDLPRADSLFAAATGVDRTFARAHAWRAQANFWMAGMSGVVRRAAEQAIAVPDRSSSMEHELAAALLDLANGDFPAACSRYAALAEQNSRDYAAVRGLADCHGLDMHVIPDRASPSGWSFRSSGHRALLYHQRAFELLPASHRSFRTGRFLQLRQSIFYTGMSAQREGRNAAGERFLARPAWEDSLAFFPSREQDVHRAQQARTSSAVAAVTHLRRIFFDVTAGWVSAYPQSADALEAHAIAMELQGDTRALATLDRARAFASDPEHAINLSISEFWLRLKRAVPNSHGDIRSARLLADSILEYRDAMGQSTARRLSAVAAITGRAHRAAELARHSVESDKYPLSVVEAGAALLAYAAVGGAADSLGAYETRVEVSIRNLVRPDDAARARAELLGRPASLALPGYRMSIIDSDELADDYLISALSASGRGDHDRVRTVLASVADRRKSVRPADIKVEVLLPEAWMLLRMGDAQAALDWLAPTLDEVRYIEPGGLEDVAAAGPLARAMALRAEIVQSLGDTTAARVWAGAFAELWTNADPELLPVLKRARQLAGIRNGN